MNNKKENIIRDSFAEMLNFLAFKVRNGSMTMSDIDAIIAVLNHDACILVTVKELAEYYGQSEDNIRHVIHRKVTKQPIRRVFYDFHSFQKAVPSQWHRKTYDSES